MRGNGRSISNAVAWASVLVLLLACGCQQKMAAQPSFDTYEPCEFFKDGMTARQLPQGTVARGHLRIDSALFTGIEPGSAARSPAASSAGNSSQQPSVDRLLAAEAARFEGVVDEFPIPVTREVVEHGRNRFMIYCVVCHDPLGAGHGKIVERGYTKPPSYHIDRLRDAPVGHFFRVITEGYGSMPSYAAQIPVRDRWAIVAYVRALQLSQHFSRDELPEQLRQKWQAKEQKLAGG